MMFNAVPYIYADIDTNIFPYLDAHIDTHIQSNNDTKSNSNGRRW